MSHTTTGEWKSFEIRMRHRRAERLVARADAAADAGRFAEARDCLAEAQRLAPTTAGIAAVEDKLAAPARAETVVARRTWPGAAAMLAVLALGGWLLRPQVPLPSRDYRAVQLAIPAASSASVAVEATPAASSVVQPDTTVAPTPDRAEDADVPVSVAAVGPSAGTGNETPGPLATLPAVPPPVPPPARTTEPVPVPVAPLPVNGDVAAVAAAVDALSLTAPPAPPAPIPAPRADAAVRGALDRYAAAYSALDADAAGRVFPRVNRAALSRAFDSLASQQISLGQCRIDITGAAAHASCAGTATWEPKVGGGGTRTESRQWTFELTRAGTEWQILNARVQNR